MSKTIIDIGTFGKNRLHIELYTAINSNDDEWLNELLDKNIDLNILFTSKELPSGYTPSPLMVAVRANNPYAVRIIANKMNIQGILDLSEEANSESLIHNAIRNGHPEIVRYLLSYKFNPNSPSDEELPINTVFRLLPSFSLICDGEWGENVNKEKLLKWYNSEKNEDFPENAKFVLWKGNLNIVEQLLKAGADVTIPDKFGNTVLDLLNTLTNPLHYKRKIFQSDNYDQELISVNQDEIVFKTNLVSRRGKSKKQITLTYDVKEVSKLIQKYHELNKGKGIDSIKLKNLEQSMMEQKERVEKHETEIADGREQRFAAQQRKILVSTFALNEGLNTFYEALKKKVYNKLNGGSILDSGLVSREKYANGDMVSSGIKTGGAFIPGVGGIAKVVGAGVQKLSDKNEANKHDRLVDNIPAPEILPGFCNDVAIELTEHLKSDISNLNEKRAKQLAIRVAKAAYEIMVAKPLKGDIKKILIDELKGSKSVNDKLASLIKSQDKDDKKQQIIQQKQQQQLQQGQTATTVQFQNYQKQTSGNGKVSKTFQVNGKTKKDKCVVM